MWVLVKNNLNETLCICLQTIWTDSLVKEFKGHMRWDNSQKVNASVMWDKTNKQQHDDDFRIPQEKQNLKTLLRCNLLRVTPVLTHV